MTSRLLEGRQLRGRCLTVTDRLLRDAEGKVAPGSGVSSFRLVLRSGARFLEILLRLRVVQADVAHVHTPSESLQMK